MQLNPKHPIDELYRQIQGGSSEAMLVSAIFKELGLPDSSPDPLKALELYISAAEAGSAVAAYRASLMFEEGRVTDRNSERAFQLALSAAKNGLNTAQTFVGICYDMGIGVSRNTDQAFLWLERAIENRDPEAAHYLGMVFSDGLWDTPNPEMAFRYFNIAATLGDIESHYYVGTYYEKGDVVDQNSELALAHFSEAANGQFAPALTKLMFIYRNGSLGVKKNERMAQHYKKLLEAISGSDEQGEQNE